MEVPTCFLRVMLGVSAFTRILAVEVFPLPAVVEVTVTLLVLRPVVAFAVTFTEKRQDAPADKVPPVIVILFPPAMALIVCPVNVPISQVTAVNPLGDATVNPAGKVSPPRKPTPAKSVERLGLYIVKVNFVVPFVNMEEAPNAFVITGGIALTVKSATPYPTLGPPVILGPVSVEEIFVVTL